MKAKYVFWVVVPVALAVGAYALRSPHVSREVATLTGFAPVIELPAQPIDLGEQEVQRVAVARFKLANRGGGTLVIDDIRNSHCTCSGLEREVDGKFTRLESLQLARDQEETVAIRVAVNGQPGDSMPNRVSFRTNDPTRPSAAIDVVISRITGGIRTFPASVVLGRLRQGSVTRETLEVRDFSRKPRRIKLIESSNPERFSARLLEGPGPDIKQEGAAAGTLVGRVEVVVRAQEIGLVEGVLFIHLDESGRPPDSVAVTGRVAAPVEAYPPFLLLPRYSSTGPVYYGKCHCRSTGGETLVLEADAVPPEISVQITADDDDASVQIVRIESSVPDLKADRPEPRVVRLRAVLDGRDQWILDIPVSYRQELSR